MSNEWVGGTLLILGLVFIEVIMYLVTLGLKKPEVLVMLIGELGSP